MAQALQTPTQAASVSASIPYCVPSKQLSIPLTDPFGRVTSAGSSKTLIPAWKRTRELLQLLVAYLLVTKRPRLCVPGSTL